MKKTIVLPLMIDPNYKDDEGLERFTDDPDYSLPALVIRPHAVHLWFLARMKACGFQNMADFGNALGLRSRTQIYGVMSGRDPIGPKIISRLNAIDPKYRIHPSFSVFDLTRLDSRDKGQEAAPPESEVPTKTDASPSAPAPKKSSRGAKSKEKTSKPTI